MLLVSMMSPLTVRRWACAGLSSRRGRAGAAAGLRHRFRQGAVRWYSLGFASVQPSEFLKPVFVVFAAWMIAASQDLGGPPGKTVSLLVTMMIVGLLAMQPDFGQAALVLFAWG
jgi:cell division protein FtsW